MEKPERNGRGSGLSKTVNMCDGNNRTRQTMVHDVRVNWIEKRNGIDTVRQHFWMKAEVIANSIFYAYRVNYDLPPFEAYINFVNASKHTSCTRTSTDPIANRAAYVGVGAAWYAHMERLGDFKKPKVSYIGVSRSEHPKWSSVRIRMGTTSLVIFIAEPICAKQVEFSTNALRTCVAAHFRLNGHIMNSSAAAFIQSRITVRGVKLFRQSMTLLWSCAHIWPKMPFMSMFSSCNWELLLLFSHLVERW